ncbi:hypothetical protein HMPREF9544_03191, partial [Escherichia coli MS 153-1]
PFLHLLTAYLIRTVRTNKLFIFKISIQFNILNMNVSVFKMLHLSGFFLIFNAAL